MEICCCWFFRENYQLKIIWKTGWEGIYIYIYMHIYIYTLIYVIMTICVKKRGRKRTCQHWRGHWRIGTMTRRLHRKARRKTDHSYQKQYCETRISRTEIIRKQKLEEKNPTLDVLSDISYEKTCTWLKKGKSLERNWISFNSSTE